jgi:hypothetical protein
MFTWWRLSENSNFHDQTKLERFLDDQHHVYKVTIVSGPNPWSHMAALEEDMVWLLM